MTIQAATCYCFSTVRRTGLLGGAALMLAALFYCEGAGASELTAVETKLRPEPISEACYNDHFGEAVAVDGDLMAIGAPDVRESPSQLGAIDVYRRQADGSWQREAVLTAEEGHEHYRLGDVVAIGGETIATASYLRLSGSPDEVAYIHVFVRTEAGWIQEQIVDAITGDWGYLALAVYGDRLAASIIAEMDGSEDDTGMVRVYRRNEGVWELETTLATDDPEESRQFGRAVDIEFNRLAVSSPRALCSSGERAGRIYVYENSEGTWTETARIDRPAGVSGGSYGWSVALKGDQLAVGQTGSYSASGRAYVFERIEGLWEHVATAAPEDETWRPTGYAAFSGERLVLPASLDSEEGGSGLFVFERILEGWREQTRIDLPTTQLYWHPTFIDYHGAGLCVGLPWMCGPSSREQGRAFVYTESDGTWTRGAVLHRADGVLSDGDTFGDSVALQGSMLLVGAPYDYGLDGQSVGAVYIYKYSDGERHLLRKMRTPEAWPHNSFGKAAALSEEYAVITAFNSAFVYRRDADELVLEEYIPNPDESQNSHFGASAAIDGDRMIIGALYEDVDGIENAGAAYVYVHAGGEWVQQARLTASDPVEDAQFGGSVAIDGDRAVVGAYRAHNDDDYRGAAYVFKACEGGWSEEARLDAEDYGAGIWFGISTGIEGDTIAIGAPKVNNPGCDGGRVFIFTYERETWSLTASLRPDTPLVHGEFGFRLALRGGRMAVGAPSESDGDMWDHGGAYLFYEVDGVWRDAHRFVASDTHRLQYFGRDAVAVDGSQVVVGAPYDGNTSGLIPGAAYCYDVWCTGDVDGDWEVGLSDLTVLLSWYGTDSGAERGWGDLDGDGDVDISDLAIVLGSWGGSCL